MLPQQETEVDHTAKGHQENLQSWKIFSILIWVVYIYRNHQAVPLGLMYSMDFLYFNYPLFKDTNALISEKHSFIF